MKLLVEMPVEKSEVVAIVITSAIGSAFRVRERFEMESYLGTMNSISSTQ
jgi:hypothetical protein